MDIITESNISISGVRDITGDIDVENEIKLITMSCEKVQWLFGTDLVLDINVKGQRVEWSATYQKREVV